MNPAATIASKLLDHACQNKASDIHFYPFPTKNKTSVYFRILGERKFQHTIEKSTYQLLLTYFKFKAGMDIGEIRRPQNGTLLHKAKNINYALRLSTLPISNMESLTIRILPQEDTPILEQLFLFPNQVKKMKSLLRKTAGIILFTGATGSGKTTTMYALLESLLRERSFQAITLEDPVERRIDDILQMEVNEKAGVTYQTGLKAALRHDPDILMVGEIRDRETAKFAFQASLTGHLVLSTLHAKDAEGTLDRLVDLGIHRTDIGQSLIGVVALQLLPIQQGGTINKRASIAELLMGELLQSIIKGENVMTMKSYDSFNHLRKKAYIYGFISKEVYEEE